MTELDVECVHQATTSVDIDSTLLQLSSCRLLAHSCTVHFVVDMFYKQICNKSTRNRTSAVWALVYSMTWCLQCWCLQCFDAVGCAAGRASGLWKTEWWDADMVMCLGQGADLLMAGMMPLPLTISCSSKSRLVLLFWCWLTRVVPDKI